jgi:hypothetical protein
LLFLMLLLWLLLFDDSIVLPFEGYGRSDTMLLT